MFRCSASLYLDGWLELPPLEADYFFPSDIVWASAKYLIHSCVWLCLGLAVEVSQYILQYVGFIIYEGGDCPLYFAVVVVINHSYCGVGGVIMPPSMDVRSSLKKGFMVLNIFFIFCVLCLVILPPLRIGVYTRQRCTTPPLVPSPRLVSRV